MVDRIRDLIERFPEDGAVVGFIMGRRKPTAVGQS